MLICVFFFFQAEDGIRDYDVTGVQTCALPIYPLDIYKGVVWEHNPQLMYLAMQDQWYTFNMFDAQAWYARDVILGKIELPSFDEMQRHTKEQHELEVAEDDAGYAIKFQGDYIQMLIDETDYPNFDIEGMRQTFLSWKKDKKEDIMTDRKSVV